MRSILLGLSLLGAISASASTQEAVLLRLNLQVGQKYVYSVKVSQAFDAPELEFLNGKASTQGRMILDVVGKEGANYVIEAKMVGMVVQRNDGMAAPVPDDKFTIVQSPSGKIIKVQSGNPIMADSIARSGLVGLFPEKAIQVGDEWSQDFKSDPEADMPRMKMVYQVVERSKILGRDSLVIKSYQDPAVNPDVTASITTACDVKTGMAVQVKGRITTNSETVKSTIDINYQLTDK